MKGKQHTFTITHYSEDEEKELTGTFTCRRQSILDQSRIQRRKAELCGGMFCVLDDNGNPTGQGIDEQTESVNYVLAVLETVLIQKPTWWNLDELSDQILVRKVFDEVRKFENSFRRRRGDSDTDGQSSGSSEEGGEKESQGSVAGNQPKKVVGGEVLASLDA